MSISGPPDQNLLVCVERSLVARYRAEPARASVSFLGVEPIEVLRFDTGSGSSAYVSLGMSREPMGGSNERLATEAGVRAELVVHSRGSAVDLWRRLAVLAAAPAVEGVVYRDGMTVDLGSPLAERSRCTGALVVASGLPSVVSDLAEVQILELMPATSTELAWCRVHGAKALRERWASQQVDQRDLMRNAARLD